MVSKDFMCLSYLPNETIISIPVFLPGKFPGRRSLVGYGPRGCRESATAEGLSTQIRIASFHTVWLANGHRIHSWVANGNKKVEQTWKKVSLYITLKSCHFSDVSKCTQNMSSQCKNIFKTTGHLGHGQNLESHYSRGQEWSIPLLSLWGLS